MNSKQLKQFVYLDFDGAETVYSGDILTIDNVSVRESGFSDPQIEYIASVLNAKYSGEVIFVTEAPVDGEYSTIYIGITDAFKPYGDFSGMAETIDSGNLNKRDNAFVLVDSASSVDVVIETVSHETDHIVYGKSHSVTTETIADYAAAISLNGSNQTFGGVSDVRYEDLKDEVNWDCSKLPDTAKTGIIEGDGGVDKITFAANLSRAVRGIDLGGGNDIITLQNCGTSDFDDSEVEVYYVSGDDNSGVVDMGSGDDTITVGKHHDLEATRLLLGDGNDKVTVSGDLDVWDHNIYESDNWYSIYGGNGNDTLEFLPGSTGDIGGIDFGAGSDSLYVAAGSEPYTVHITMGSGNDTVTIDGVLEADWDPATFDFGDGNDTLIINGGILGLRGSLETVENISGNGWVTVKYDETGEQLTLNASELARLKNAGISIYNTIGYSWGFYGPQQELSDNVLATADTWPVYEEVDREFYLCGEQKASSVEYGFADPVDYIRFYKRGEATVQFGIDSCDNIDNFTLSVLDSKGNLVRNIDIDGYDFPYGEQDISTLADGTYYLKLAVTSNSYASGYIEVEYEDGMTGNDISILNYTVSDTSINSNGTVKLSFNYVNAGTTDIGSTVLKVYDGNTLLRTFTMGAVSAGDYRSATVTLNASELGTGARKLYLVADANNQVAEIDELNNKAYRTVTVASAGTRDLCIKDYNVSSSTIDKSGSVKLSFKYANNGNTASGASVLKVYDGNTLLRTFNMGSVAAGSYNNASVTLKGSELGNGARKIFLVVDANNQITETNEANNKAYRTVTVNAGTKDLCIKDYNVSSSTIDKSGSVKLSFKYANNGNTASGASVLKVYDGNTLLRTFNMGSVEAGSFRNGTVTLKGSELGNGARKIFLVVDANNQITETNEANNKAYRTVTVNAATPDLCIQDYQVSSNSISKDGSVKLSFKYANKGSGNAGASVLKVYDGNTLLRTFNMGSVAAGSFRNGTVTLKGSELGNGDRKLFLVVDANNQLAEANEANNKAYRTVNVATTPLLESTAPEWNMIDCADFNSDGFEDLLVTDFSPALGQGIAPSDAEINDILFTLGDGWSYSGIADWNGDKVSELLFCGSDVSSKPEAEDNKLFTALA